MTDLILHHYDRSPYSEKIRLAFGRKNLTWRSVLVPRMLPKPDLMPLTGGYRRTPVMQIGADVYCDTSLILREIERRHPQPSLFPPHDSGVVSGLSWWIEKAIFFPAVSFAASFMDFPAEFVADRKAFANRDFSKAACLDIRPLNRQRLHAHLHRLAAMLADGRTFLLGDAPTAVDLSAYHPIWFIHRNGGEPAVAMLPLAPLAAWQARVAGLGHGTRQEIGAQDALDMASNAEPEPLQPQPNGDPAGLEIGSPVVVRADDSGRDPIHGILVAADAEEVVIRRHDPRVGDIHLHVPRAGFDVSAG